MSDYATREPRSLSSSLYSHANSEEHFSEEYFRASVIDGTRHVVRFVLEFFLFTKSKARCIFSTRSERVDCVFHLRADAQEGEGVSLSIFFRGLFRNWIRSQREAAWRDSRVSREIVFSDDSRDDATAEITRHSFGRTSRRRIARIFIFRVCLFFLIFLFLFLLFSTGDTSSPALQIALNNRRKQKR